jgi:Gpi18-like mannosyltransferase
MEILKRFIKSLVDNPFYIFSVLLFAFGLYLKFSVTDFYSGDYVNFLKPWMNEIAAQGGIASLGKKIGDYTPPYVYLLTFLSYFPSSNATDPYLFGIKLISILFDGLLAFTVFLNVKALIKNSRFELATIASLIVFFLPTVVFNSAYWGQIDAAYTSFLLLTLYFIQKDQPFKAMVWYAVAFSFKLQSIFLVPVLIIYLWFNHPRKIYYFLMILVVYYGLAIPSFIAGRSFMDITQIYILQTDQYRYLTLNMPNMWQWVNNRYDDLSLFAFSLFAAVMGITFLWLIVRKFKVTSTNVYLLSLWSVMVANFFLPAMHERYLYAADILSVIVAFQFGKLFVVPIVIQFVSIVAYTPFLFGSRLIDHKDVSIVFFVAIIYVSYHLFTKITSKSEQITS